MSVNVMFIQWTDEMHTDFNTFKFTKTLLHFVTPKTTKNLSDGSPQKYIFFYSQGVPSLCQFLFCCCCCWTQKKIFLKNAGDQAFDCSMKETQTGLEYIECEKTVSIFTFLSKLSL